MVSHMYNIFWLVACAFHSWASFGEHPTWSTHPGNYWYLQCRHWIMALCQTSDFPFRLVSFLNLTFRKTNFEHTCWHSPGIIFTIYSTLNACSPLSAISYVGHWKCDLVTSANPENWSRAGRWLQNAHLTCIFWNLHTRSSLHCIGSSLPASFMWP